MTWVIAVLLGVAASLAAWAIIQLSARPRISVSKVVTGRQRSDGSRSYRLKIINETKRNVIDIDIRVYLLLNGTFPDRAGTRRIVNVTTRPQKLLGLGPKDNRLVTFRTTDDWVARLPVEEPHGLALEDMLRLGSSPGQVRLWLTYTDGFSGRRRGDRYEYGLEHIVAK